LLFIFLIVHLIFVSLLLVLEDRGIAVIGCRRSKLPSSAVVGVGWVVAYCGGGRDGGGAGSVLLLLLLLLLLLRVLRQDTLLADVAVGTDHRLLVNLLPLLLLNEGTLLVDGGVKRRAGPRNDGLHLLHLRDIGAAIQVRQQLTNLALPSAR
jgi:hypothetical protein